jgi:hypothetical protein
MDALTSAIEASLVERIIESERRAEGAEIRGDFESSVKASWVRLDDSGAGVVLYKGKEYMVKIIGSFSIPKGTPVELSYAKGIYFATY